MWQWWLTKWVSMFWVYLTGDDDSCYESLRYDIRHVQEYLLWVASCMIVDDVTCGVCFGGDLVGADFRDVACIVDCEHGWWILDYI